MNTASFAALGLICGAGNRPGRMISRGGGHQRGMMGAGGGSGWLSPEKYPGRRKKDFNLDRWLMAGEIKFAWVFGVGLDEVFNRARAMAESKPPEKLRAAISSKKT